MYICSCQYREFLFIVEIRYLIINYIPHLNGNNHQQDKTTQIFYTLIKPEIYLHESCRLYKIPLIFFFITKLVIQN